jgi:methylmalonyl-CoA mutase cobalamin-binding domain/chain
MDEMRILKKLKEGVVRFDHDEVIMAANHAVTAGVDPKKALGEAIKGLEEVDKIYQEEDYFLPDLIMAAEAVNEATKILFRNQVNGPSQNSSVILATLEGDIHDIGKNILATFVSGLGVKVLDLGVDVGKGEIADSVRTINPKVIALSTMLTTSRFKVKEVIKELDKRGLKNGLKIILGGISTSEKFAKSVGADAYAKNALEGSLIIKNWIK